MRTFLLASISVVFGITIGVALVKFVPAFNTSTTLFVTASPTPTPEPERPLLAYTIPSLRARSFQPASITLEQKAITSDDTHSVYPYAATVLGRTMTGVINLPAAVTSSTSAVMMLRGWVPPNSYAPGTGTKNAAAAYAAAGFVTIAPDFFGYGASDPEPTDEWQARFEKPAAIIELIRGLQQNGISLPDGSLYKPEKIALWGHSNGGQIALTTLSITGDQLPTILWAPVSAPFPYSILYFTDEEEDEGQQSRKWIANFEKLYNAREFSFTNYLDGLKGPLLLHQGTNDDAVLQWWTTEFTQKLDRENTRRAELAASTAATLLVATSSGSLLSSNASASAIPAITYKLHLYPGADHNMRPDWQTVVDQDIEFLKRELFVE